VLIAGSGKFRRPSWGRTGLAIFLARIGPNRQLKRAVWTARFVVPDLSGPPSHSYPAGTGRLLKKWDWLPICCVVRFAKPQQVGCLSHFFNSLTSRFPSAVETSDVAKSLSVDGKREKTPNAFLPILIVSERKRPRIGDSGLRRFLDP
jgi:hypothetical protein